MSIYIRVLLNLFGLHQILGNKRNIEHTCFHFPDDDILDTIAFYLFTCNINTGVLWLDWDKIKQPEYPFVAEIVGERGEKKYIHFENGNAHQLYPRFIKEDVDRLATEGTNPFKVLMFDTEALKQIKFPVPPDFERKARGNTKIIKTTVWLFCSAVLAGIVFLFLPKPVFLIIAGMCTCINFIISLLLFFKESEVFYHITKPFCSTENYLGCSRLLKSGFSKAVGEFTWAKTGLIYYGGLFIFLLIAPVNSEITLITTGLVIFAAVMSVLLIYKMIRINVYCKLCIGIHVTNFLCLASAFIFNSNVNIHFVTLVGIGWVTVSLILSVTMVFYLSFFIKKIKSGQEKNEILKNLKLALLNTELVKKNDDAFAQLKSFYTPLRISGDSDSEVKLSLILSLDCNHCSALINTIVLNNLVSHTCFTEIFIYSDEEKPENINFLRHLQINGKNRSINIAKELKSWYDGTYKRKSSHEISGTEIVDFCLSAKDMSHKELPAIFINDKHLNTGFTATDIPAVIFYANRLPRRG